MKPTYVLSTSQGWARTVPETAQKGCGLRRTTRRHPWRNKPHDKTMVKQGQDRRVFEVKWQCCVCVSVVYVHVFALHCAVHSCARHAYTYRHIAPRHRYARQM